MYSFAPNPGKENWSCAHCERQTPTERGEVPIRPTTAKRYPFSAELCLPAIIYSYYKKKGACFQQSCAYPSIYLVDNREVSRPTL